MFFVHIEDPKCQIAPLTISFLLRNCVALKRKNHACWFHKILSSFAEQLNNTTLRNISSKKSPLLNTFPVLYVNWFLKINLCCDKKLGWGHPPPPRCYMPDHDRYIPWATSSNIFQRIFHKMIHLNSPKSVRNFVLLFFFISALPTLLQCVTYRAHILLSINSILYAIWL